MKSKWIVSLSNGETIDETKNIGPDQNRSPWLNMIDYIKEKNIEIRHAKIIVNGIEYNSPTYNKQGRFENEANVGGFWVARRFIQLIVGIGPAQIKVIELSYRCDGVRHHIIVDEDTNRLWMATTNLDNPESMNAAIKRYCGDDY